MEQRVARVEPGRGRVLQVGGASVALFNLDGEHHAIGNVCPHARGPLGEGILDGGVVTCPWHAWRFDVASGACLTVRSMRVPCYAVREDGDAVVVSDQALPPQAS